MNTIIALLEPRIIDLLQKINQENNELLDSDNYADFIQRMKSLEQIDKELSDFSATFLNNTSNDISIGICKDNLHFRSERLGHFNIIFKKDYMKENLLDNYEIEGQSAFIDTFLKYFSNVIYLNISFFSLEKRYKALQKSLNVSLIKEINFIKESLIKTQDYEKIVDNILNGVHYVKFNIRKNNVNTKLSIEMKNTYMNIPNFEKDSLYLPKIKNGTLEDYLKTYKEFNSLILLDEDDDKLKFINIVDSFKLLKHNNINTNSHDVCIKPTPSMKKLKEEYLTIISYIKEKNVQKEQLDNEQLEKRFFYLTFNKKNKIIYGNYTTNPAFLNLNICFDLNILNDKDNSLLKPVKPSIYYHEFDKQKIIDFQRIKENMKYF